jgi:hypothetical protein
LGLDRIQGEDLSWYLRESLDKEVSEIIHLIEKSKRKLTPQERWAELLKRNQRFQGDYFELFFDKKISWHQGIIIDTKPKEFNCIKEDFLAFCKIWQIRPNWNGRQESLGKHIKRIPAIVCDVDSLPKKIIQKYYSLLEDAGENYTPSVAGNLLMVKIGPDTNMDDIKNLWPKIKEMKKAIFGQIERKKKKTKKQKYSFETALCWRDLNTPGKHGKWSCGKIAVQWPRFTGKRPSRNTIKETIRRIEQSITRLNRKPIIFEPPDDWA